MFQEPGDCRAGSPSLVTIEGAADKKAVGKGSLEEGMGLASFVLELSFMPSNPFANGLSPLFHVLGMHRRTEGEIQE